MQLLYHFLGMSNLNNLDPWVTAVIPKYGYWPYRPRTKKTIQETEEEDEEETEKRRRQHWNLYCNSAIRLKKRTSWCEMNKRMNILN